MNTLIRFLCLMLLTGRLMAADTATVPPSAPDPQAAHPPANAPTIGNVARDEVPAPSNWPANGHVVPELTAGSAMIAGGAPKERYVVGIQSRKDGDRIADVYDAGFEARVRIGDPIPSGKVVAITSNRVDIKDKGNKTISLFMRSSQQVGR